MTHTVILVGTGGGGGDTAELACGMADYPAFTINAKVGADIVLARPAGIKSGFFGDRIQARGVSAAYADEIGAKLAGHSAAVVIAALGGGAGTGTLITVSDCARKQSMKIIAVVLLPFVAEGGDRRKRALEELNDLTAFADRIIVMDMQQVVPLGQDMKASEVLQAADLLAAEAAVTVARLYETAPFFSTFSQEAYSFSYGAGADLVTAVRTAMARPLYELDPSAGKMVVCPEAVLAPDQAEAVSTAVADLTGIIPEVISGRGTGSGVMVFMPISFRLSE